MGTPQSAVQTSLAWAATGEDPHIARQILRADLDRRWPHRVAFARWLARHMRAAGIRSGAALAHQAGIDATTITGWASGRAKPSLDNLTQVARVLRVEPREAWVAAGLVTAAQVADPDLADRQAILGSDLPDAAKDDLLRMLDGEIRADRARRSGMVAAALQGRGLAVA